MKRKKRLEKGIESIKEEIAAHEEKREKAREEGNMELAGYYDKELSGLKKTKKRKENQLEKSRIY